ncbi:hypothetical protein, partial [uncultured Rubinisphaera sp.]|uniref:hypothetical protein n=1 Tax=uncultured Rubinisphaera sp. TaxID=1678686 RepID=UPI0030DC5B82
MILFGGNSRNPNTYRPSESEMRLPLSWLRKLLERMESRDFQLSGKWFLLSMILGVVVGLVTVVFDHLSLLVETLVLK